MHEKVARHLAGSLKRLMKERDLSISLLNKRTGVSRETLYRILRAESLPTTDVLLRLASELGISAASLLEVDNVRKKGANPTAERDLVMDMLTSIESRLAKIEAAVNKR
jgi:transcriptional regulator with XRE-family HTH domain